MEEVVMDVPVKSGGLDITLSVVNRVVPEPYPVSKRVFGMDIDECMGRVNAQGRLVIPADKVHLDYTGVVSIVGWWQLAYKWANSGQVVSAIFPDLETVGDYVFDHSFYDASSLEEIGFPKLKSVNSNGMQHAFNGTTKLTRAEFPALELLRGVGDMFRASGLKEVYFPKVKEVMNAGGGTFRDCKQLKIVSVPLLEKTDAYSFNYMWENCIALETISFPSLKTVPKTGFGSSIYNYAFRGCTQNGLEIHFRADARAAIEATTGYDTKWGATNATIIFDL